jgi:hypothetical protein
LLPVILSDFKCNFANCKVFSRVKYCIIKEALHIYKKMVSWTNQLREAGVRGSEISRFS